jgi:hypothetical protein
MTTDEAKRTAGDSFAHYHMLVTIRDGKPYATWFRRDDG